MRERDGVARAASSCNALAIATFSSNPHSPDNHQSLDVVYWREAFIRESWKRSHSFAQDTVIPVKRICAACGWRFGDRAVLETELSRLSRPRPRDFLRLRSACQRCGKEIAEQQVVQLQRQKDDERSADAVCVWQVEALTSETEQLARSQLPKRHRPHLHMNVGNAIDSRPTVCPAIKRWAGRHNDTMPDVYIAKLCIISHGQSIMLIGVTWRMW